jgi:hypothetical protein
MAAVVGLILIIGVAAGHQHAPQMAAPTTPAFAPPRLVRAAPIRVPSPQAPTPPAPVVLSSPTSPSYESGQTEGGQDTPDQAAALQRYSDAAGDPPQVSMGLGNEYGDGSNLGAGDLGARMDIEHGVQRMQADLETMEQEYPEMSAQSQATMHNQTAGLDASDNQTPENQARAQIARWQGVLSNIPSE